MHSLLALSLLSGALAVPWGPKPWHGRPGHEFGKAAYFLENNPSGSSIVSLHIGEDGKISDPVRTSTGGVGSISINATDGSMLPADSMGGQDAVTVSGEMLFTLNAGSDTLVMFRIDPEDPWHPTMVGSPVSTMGEYPMSVTYSEKLKTACVLNGGAKAGVSCFTADPWKGLKPSGPFRQFPLSVINETTPPMGPPGSAGDIYFKPDSSAVFCSIKGRPDLTPIKPGTLVAYPVIDGAVSTEAVGFVKSDILVDFGAVWISDTKLLLSDAGSGGHLLDIPADLYDITEVANIVIPGQSAACWADYSAVLDTGYIMDAGLPLIYTINPSTGAMEGEIKTPDYTMGLFDEAIMDEKMYVLTGANGVAVVDLKEKSQMQFLNLTGFGNRQFYQGMALWPSWP